MMATDTVTEWCPYCEHEVELERDFKAQNCPNCKDPILPCNQCETQNCTNCPINTITAYRVLFDFGDFEITAWQKTKVPKDADEVAAMVQERLQKQNLNVPYSEAIVTVEESPEWLDK